MDDPSTQQRIGTTPKRGVDSVLLTRTWVSRVRLSTNWVLAGTAVTILLFDWDTYLETDRHILSGVRRNLRRGLDSLYGIEAPVRPPTRRPITARFEQEEF